MKRRLIGDKKLLFTKRFYPAGNYTWTVPSGCTEVEVFLVGGGAGARTTSRSFGGGGSGYTKTFRGKGYIMPSSSTWQGTYEEGRDGNAIAVIAGEAIPIIVGAGGNGVDGGYSQFLNSDYRAEGGQSSRTDTTLGDGGNGGSGGAGQGAIKGGSNGSNGDSSSEGASGVGQGHTTRDFGEPTGKINAGGGTGVRNGGSQIGGVSDYQEGCGEDGSGYLAGYHGGKGGGGYGGGAGATIPYNTSTKGGDGTVLIRYWAYHE